jgi:hypothetical protein
MPCIISDTPLTRQELHDRAVNLVAMVRNELTEWAVELAAFAAVGDDAADYADKVRKHLNRELAAKLQHFKELIVIA